jgi:hypothetical protein
MAQYCRTRAARLLTAVSVPNTNERLTFAVTQNDTERETSQRALTAPVRTLKRRRGKYSILSALFLCFPFPLTIVQAALCTPSAEEAD